MARARRKTNRKAGEPPAHETPTMGPRQRPRKVRPASTTEPRGHDYHPGAKAPPRNPWVDEGNPEVNG